MKVLWCSNIIFPEAAKAIGAPQSVFGGWMVALAEDVADAGVKLAIASLYNGPDVKKVETDRAVYFLLPGLKHSHKGYDPRLREHWKQVLREFVPDCIHVHGTEYAYPLPLLEVCGSIPVVVSLQGIIGVLWRFYMAGLGFATALRYRTLKEWVRGDGMIGSYRRYRRSSCIERRILELAGNAIGRTEWDHANVQAINPVIRYFKCNESLRSEFYSRTWDIDKVQRHSIFASQASYPLKGLHLLLKALAIVKRRYPDVQLRIAGRDITDRSGFAQRLRMSGYGIYILKLMKDLNLEGSIRFLGTLNAASMADELSNAHLFTLNSSIENSPNSLGEAQLMGTPCVASFVGGVPDMVTDSVDGLLYNFEEPAVLANRIMAVFADDGLARSLSEGGRVKARQRHDRATNLETMLGIYRTITEGRAGAGEGK